MRFEATLGLANSKLLQERRGLQGREEGEEGMGGNERGGGREEGRGFQTQYLHKTACCLDATLGRLGDDNRYSINSLN